MCEAFSDQMFIGVVIGLALGAIVHIIDQEIQIYFRKKDEEVECADQQDGPSSGR